MRTWMFAIVALLALAAGLGSRPAAAQRVTRAVIGGAIGVAGGTVITLSVIVARARFQGSYLDSVEDLVHWQTLPMAIAPAAGALFGWRSDEALRGSVAGSAAGMVIGTAVGAGIGWLMSDRAEAPWAGGVIGAGLGMTIGGILLGARGWVESGDDGGGGSGGEPVRVGVRVPL